MKKKAVENAEGHLLSTLDKLLLYFNYLFLLR